MIDTNELRRLAQAAMHPVTKGRWMRLFGERTVYDRMEDGCRGIPVASTPISPPHPFEAACLDFIAAANPQAITELLDRLEAAEEERDWHAERCEDAMNERDALRAENAGLVDDMNLLRDNNTALRARIEEMDKQESVATVIKEGDSRYWMSERLWTFPDGKYPLYALPGAQPAPSVTDGWLRAIDEALVTAHIGVANANDTYEQAKAKLDNLIGFNVDIATDPAVNGGYKLVPVEPTKEMIQKACSDHGYPHGDSDVYARGYRSMLAAAQEAKP